MLAQKYKFLVKSIWYIGKMTFQFKNLVSFLCLFLLIISCSKVVDIEGDVYLIKGDGTPQPAAAKNVSLIKFRIVLFAIRTSHSLSRRPLSVEPTFRRQKPPAVIRYSAHSLLAANKLRADLYRLWAAPEQLLITDLPGRGENM